VSLRLRLALWYGGLTGSIILIVGTLALGLHSRAQYDNLDRALEGAVEHVLGAHSGGPLSHQIEAMLASPILPNVGIRIYDRSGVLLAASPNALVAPDVDPRIILDSPGAPAYDTLASWMPPFSIMDGGHGAFDVVHDAEGHRWRLFAHHVDDGTAYFLAEAPLREIDASVETLRRLVPLSAVLGAIITLVAGLLLAGSALRPVAALTDTATSIARSRDLDRRVPVSARRDELGQMALTFNEMLDSLAHAVEAQQRFVADASHELRAPLTAIQANLELLERQHTLDPDQREMVTEASREAHRLSRLVADLLALARADAGIALQAQPVELDRVLLEALREARHLAREQTLLLDRFEPVTVGGDADWLKQLLLILLDNALKYTPAGGEVSVSLWQEAERVLIRIQDTGVGIPEKALPHVWKRFYRADPARGADPGGTGLGLSIARWIIEQHQGQITLDSKPGEGTTVAILLPART
jgi:two-component system, OmpR family, sensor kinase